MRHLVYIIVSLLLSSLALNAQEVSIHLGEQKVALNETFSIKIISQNIPVRSHSSFPDIKGFKKRAVKSNAETNLVNGHIVSVYELSQTYEPKKEGDFILKPFTIRINDTKVGSQGCELKVGPAKEKSHEAAATENIDPKQLKKLDLENIHENAFLSLSVSDDKIYAGQALTVSVALYVGADNRVELEFFELGSQLKEIQKKMKPANCLEQFKVVDEIIPEKIQINGKGYTRLKLFQAAYFPVGATDLQFPALNLKMLKYKLIKNKDATSGYEKQQEIVVFSSAAKRVFVKALPPHPLKNRVSVGQFKLTSSLSKSVAKSGESVLLSFKVSGVGSFGANPFFIRTHDLDVFEPEVIEKSLWKDNSFEAERLYKYYVVPKEGDILDLKRYFAWVYFDPIRERYDTLSPHLNLRVKGVVRVQEEKEGDYSGFYSLIEKEKNTFVDYKGEEFYKVIANNVLLVMFVVSSYFLVKRQKRFRAVLRKGIRKVNVTKK